jgi:hypothetical protein
MCNTNDLDRCVLTCELVTGRSALSWDSCDSVDYAPYVTPMAWTMLPLCCSVVAVLWFGLWPGLCGESMCLPMLASIIHLWATIRDHRHGPQEHRSLYLVSCNERSLSCANLFSWAPVSGDDVNVALVPTARNAGCCVGERPLRGMRPLIVAYRVNEYSWHNKELIAEGTK